jgi:hypothetical protein
VGPRGVGPGPPGASSRVGAGPLSGGPPSGDILMGGYARGRAGYKGVRDEDDGAAWE